jgi:hypothetical protein
MGCNLQSLFTPDNGKLHGFPEGRAITSPHHPTVPGDDVVVSNMPVGHCAKSEICEMTSDTHDTAPTQFVEANGIRFAYRRSAIRKACRSSSTSISEARWTTGTQP